MRKKHGWKIFYLNLVKIKELKCIMQCVCWCYVRNRIEDNYNTFKEDCVHNAIVMRYVDVGWIGQNYYCRRMRTRFGRLFPNGFVNSTNLVERMWHFIKYTLIIANKSQSQVGWASFSYYGEWSLNGEQMGGMNLIEHSKEH